MVRGCNTLAPKYESSMASIYDKTGIVVAVGTIRGSVVRIPCTSFHNQISSAPTAAPTIAALKSDPPRPRVVIIPDLFIPMNPVITGIELNIRGLIQSAILE